jgi:hypothetical protein
VGFFKDIKDVKEAVAGAPGVITHAQQVAAQGEQLMAATAAAQHVAAEEARQKAEQEIAAEGASADLTPIAGVSLELYAQISKGLAAVGYEASRAVEVARGKGVSAESWQQAMDGWNARIGANAAVAKQFNQLYVGA